ncbi:ribosome assembly RNA-binding protein YhbY [Lentilactobacillus sp. IMAU92037]|uniref:ribosome assembly RNA-binding protein YhbY n=1 Tax=Lentilactobacillus dabitei TaxID=2831523 RepID=UPI001C2BE286|nr:ribosome assembly RNA-binding protein YhbY [Lentilactobacillus dabitei]MBV0929818.1 ribosome assembly RNA-binding protein YhbY [Lentilactobacillus dabitei]
MKLTGKQKRFLRASANRMRPIFEIGKNGLSPIWLAEIDKALDSRELIKVNLLQNAAESLTEIKDYVESNSDITVVQTIGKTLVLFKQSKNQDHQDLSKKVFSM